MKGELTMSQNEMVAKIEELNELEILMDGLKAQADAIRDDIKSEIDRKSVGRERVF